LAGTIKKAGGEFLPYIEGFSKSPEDVASNITTNRLFNDEPGELHDWLKTKLPRYIRNQLGTAEDPLVKLTDENVEKAIKQLDAYDRRISKLQDDVRKREAEFGPGSAAATKARLDDEIEASENFLEETMTRLDRGTGYSPERFEEDVLRANVKNPAFQDTPDSLARRRKEAGFPEQGTARTYLGRRREDQLDDFLTRYSAQSISTYFPKAAGDVGSGQARKYLDQIGQDTEKPLYGISTDDPMSGPNSNLVATMNHVMDELNNAMRPGTNLPPSLQIKPESLNQFDIERAVRHVNKIDEWRLQQSRGADLEGGMKSAAVYKEYPDSSKGLRWVRLKADESLPKDEARKELQEALDREGNIMGHCVGLYCDPVLEGRTEIYSLRDSKGKSHVTIEVDNNKNTEIGTFLDEVPGQAEKYGFTKSDTRYGYIWTYPRKNVDGIDQSTVDVIDQPTADKIDKTIVNSPEFKQWLDSQKKQIRQIKGKGNDKQRDAYTPYVQDFVRTGNWDINNIGDFENTDLVLRGGKLYTKEEEAARIAAEMARVEPLIAEAKEFIYKDPVFDFIRKANKKRFDMSVNNPRFRRLEDIERFDLTPDGYNLSNIEAMLDDPMAYMDRGETVLDVYQRVLAKVDEIKSNLPTIQKGAEKYGPEVDRYAAGGEVTAFIKRFSKGGAAEDDSWKDEIIRQANLKYSGMGPEDVSRMQEGSLKKRMGEEIKGVEIPSLFKEFFPNYRVVKDLKEAGNAQVFDAMPDVVFADPELVKTNPLVLPHEFEHSMEGKARKRYAHSSFKEGAEKPNLPLPGKPEHFLEPGGKLKVSEITKKLGGGPEYFMEQSLMARGMNYEEAGDYLKNLKSSLGDVRLGDYLRNKYPDLDFRRLGNPDEKIPLAEYLADLSGIETLKGIDLTKDRFIKNFVFGGDDDLVAEYKAVTGIRQDRLDAKDLAPYVPDYDQSMASKVKRFIQEKLR